MHVAPCTPTPTASARWRPDRSRKLLLHRRQIDELTIRTTQEHLTLVPLAIYFKDGRAKVDLAWPGGAGQYDKRHAIAERDAALEARRAGRRPAGRGALEPE